MPDSTVRVAVTGAAGQIGYALLFRIASGQAFGRDAALCEAPVTTGFIAPYESFPTSDGEVFVATPNDNLFAAFGLFPLIYTAFVSLYRVELQTPGETEWRGLGNYTALFGAYDATICGLKFFGVDRTLFASDAPFDPEGGSMYIRETIAIVGPTGAGKSTLVWLLLRFVDPQQGTISLGGVDLRDIPLEDIRRHIAVVSVQPISRI